MVCLAQALGRLRSAESVLGLAELEEQRRSVVWRRRFRKRTPEQGCSLLGGTACLGLPRRLGQGRSCLFVAMGGDGEQVDGDGLGGRP
jgi:hypothetical protein